MGMSMKAEIKRFCIWDVHSEPFYPDDPDNFFAMVDMAIGPANAEGGDIFNLKVCTPRWFEENIMTKRPSDPTYETVRKNVFGRHYLFVHTYDEDQIEQEVRWIVDHVKGDNWNVIATRLSRYFGWEFEAYEQFGGLPPSF